MSFNEQIPIPFAEPKKEVTDASILSGVEGEGESYGLPKEEIKKTTEEIKKPEPAVQVIKLTEEQAEELHQNMDDDRKDNARLNQRF